ncbi:hypothetical protein A4A49_61205 [Nicotiana attenuata]|uniref:Uncharacterized protein n=1 Tax=Nicotiana attenuata TaxID=49451 RepID=A0A1J6K2X7_NICAT|nr:hypothetical protein A4A49_61205 [Nicotiana attenuata]
MTSMKKGKKAKRQRCLRDENSNNEQPMSPLATNHIIVEEEIQLSAPQLSQGSQSSHPIQDKNFRLMPTPSVQRKLPNNSVFPDFEFSDFESDSALDIRPRSFSEERTRLLMRQKGTIPAITSTINFVGDSSGVSVPLNLPHSAKNPTCNGKKAIIGNHLEKMAKMKTSKG